MAMHEGDERFKVFEAELVGRGGGESVGVEGGTPGGTAEKHGVGESWVEVTGTEEFKKDDVGAVGEGKERDVEDGEWRRGRGGGGGEEVFEVLEGFELRGGERGGDIRVFFEGGGTREESGGGGFH